jgi:NADH-quinone oxidoreductase subunit H
MTTSEIETAMSSSNLMLILHNLLWVVFHTAISIGVMLCVLVAMAYLTLAERKVMGSIQRRRGPNAIGIYGRLTPVADGLKLLRKENLVPASSNPWLFQLAPVITFALALVGWTTMPVSYGMVLADIPMGLRFRFAVGSLGVYGIILAGWSSNSKYAFLGALRSTAQMVSYEVSIGFVRVSVFLCSGTMNLSNLIRHQEEGWYVTALFPMVRRFFISALAETNRHPFDLPEDESVLVAGYNVEYSGIGFALFFLGEYTNIILISGTITCLFLGGWLSVLPTQIPVIGDFIMSMPWFLEIGLPGFIWFSRKVVFFLLLFIWARAAYPRYRYDQLIRLGWKVFLPISRSWVRRVSGVLRGFDGLP